MNRIKKLLREESGSAEAASVAVMIGALSSGLTGVWNTISVNPTTVMLGIMGGLFLLWLLFKR